MPLSPGQTFARYTIEAAIGAGGMGEVYAAFDTKLRRRVALKVIHPDLGVPDAAARLVREARAAAALTHPNTIAIHDLGEVDGVVFLVMELVSGAPLRAYVGDGSTPVTRKLRWLVAIARGLGAAHEAGLVHRDVKPTNVMISDAGVVKVLDFGLAKPVEAASFHTDVGLVVGTPRYMAPELFTGLPADARSDQYAFGVTAYELIAGVHPGGPAARVPASLDSLVPEVGPAVARIVARTLAHARAERFASMDDVASALEEAMGGGAVVVAPPSPPPVTALERAPRPVTPPSSARAPSPADALAVALAPTELSPETGGGAIGATRGPSVAGILAVLGLLAFTGVYVATRVLDASARANLDERADAAATADADAERASLTGLLDAGAAVPTSPLADGAVAASASELDAATDAAEGLLPGVPSPRTIVLDEFEDPWVRARRDARAD